MAEAPVKDASVKDVFDDGEDTGIEEDQRVVDELEEAELKIGTETAAAKAGTDDIEVVLAEKEKAEAEDAKEATVDDDEGLAVVGGAAKTDIVVDDDEDLKSYSKKVQDRIARERRLVKRAREDAETAIAGERVQRINAERNALTAHKNLTAVLLVNIDNQLKVKSTELKKLLTDVATGEDGAAGRQVDVQGEMDDLRAKKREIEGAKVSLENQAEEFERKVKVMVLASPQTTPGTHAWIEQNKWFGAKGFTAETMLVRAMDIKLAGERSDKGSQEYFRELNRRVRIEMPDLGDKVKRAFKPASIQRSAVAPVSRSAGVVTDAVGKRRVTLDKVDLQNMRDFKIDTSDPKAVALYAREKLAAFKGVE